MKYLLLSIAVIIGSGLLFGKLASNFVDQQQKVQQEKYCEALGKDWHPDCKVK
jgi:hypothetical protein